MSVEVELVMLYHPGHLFGGSKMVASLYGGGEDIW